MPLALEEIHLDESTVHIVPWYDDVVDQIGFDPRSQYVELFWLNVLGPTATWLLRRFAQGLAQYPGGYELDLGVTAQTMGLGFHPGSNGPFTRALQRCVFFGAAKTVPGGLAVRLRLPPVSMRHLQRMPAELRDRHRDWTRPPADPHSEHHRAARLADVMIETGDDPDAVERQLLGLGVRPTVALAVADAVRLSCRTSSPGR